MMTTTNALIAWIPGGMEWGIIFLVVLLLFGARKLPELARGIGRSLGEFKHARDEFEEEISRGETGSRQELQDPPQGARAGN